MGTKRAIALGFLLFFFGGAQFLSAVVAPGVGGTGRTRTMAQVSRADGATSLQTSAQIADLQLKLAAAQSAGDNAWMLMSSGLVLLMTGPGLALFYGGLVRKKIFLGQ